MKRIISLTVNDKKHEVAVNPNRTLVDLLRYDLGLTGTKKGCDEAILVDEQGLITEGASSAFFLVSERILQTAALTANILPSITRQFVIKAGRNIGLQTTEKSLTPQQAGDADELFIASTTQDITPVVKFDGKLIADGRPGKYTKLLAREFLSFTT